MNWWDTLKYNKELKRIPKEILGTLELLVDNMDSEVLSKYEKELEEVCTKYVPKLIKCKYFGKENQTIQMYNFTITSYIDSLFRDIVIDINKKM